MKIRSDLMVWALALVIAGAGCGNSGGEVNNDGALQGMMQGIALDFAQVLADVAPTFEATTTKAQAPCPEGGTADWTEDQFGQGTLSLVGCVMRGFSVTATLNGFLSSSPGSISADILSGPMTVTGARNADLNVQQLTISAQLPITDATTFWQIEATAADGTPLCAWSGGSGCGPGF